MLLLKFDKSTNLTCLFHFIRRYRGHIKMQTNFYIIAILVVLQSFANSSIETSTPATPETPAIQISDEPKLSFQSGILPLDLAKQPNPVDRSKIVAPDTPKQLYDEMMSGKPNNSMKILHTTSANTVRSFTHSGKCSSSNKTPKCNVTKKMKRLIHWEFPAGRFLFVFCVG